ncbi:hypothetical protein D3C81_1954380 [compost metagenome]
MQGAHVTAAPGQQQVGQGGALVVVKAAARLARTQHFACRYARQLLAGAVPDHHPAMHIEYKGGHDQQFHHLDGETLGFTIWRWAGMCVAIRHESILLGREWGWLVGHDEAWRSDGVDIEQYYQ